MFQGLASAGNLLKQTSHSPNRARSKGAAFLLDVSLLVLAALGAYGIRSLVPISGHVIFPLRTYAAFFSILIASWLLFMYVFGIYGSRVNQPASFLSALVRINYNFIVLVAVLTFVLRVTTTNRMLLVLFVVFSNAVTTLTHGIAMMKRSKSYTIIGTDKLAVNAFDAASRHFALKDAKFAGFLSPEAHYDDFFLKDNLPILGSMEHMLAKLPDCVDCIVMALPSDFRDQQRLLEDLDETGIMILLALHIPEGVEFTSA